MGRYADKLKLNKRLASIEAAIGEGGAIKTWADESYEPKTS